MPESPTGPSRTGRDRLRAAVLRPSRRQVVVAVLLAILGYAGVVQIRANDQDDTYAGLRDQDLIDILDGLSGTSQRAQAEIDRLTRARADLLSETSRRQAAIEQAQQEADALTVLAGLVPVTGPGIRITVTEETGTVSVGAMLDTIQELRTVRAEAIQVNGLVRIVAQSSVEEGIGGLVIDGQLVESPYVIDVIGVANTLAQAIEFPLGPRTQLEDDGAVIEVQQLPSLDIEAVRQPVQPRFADPDVGG